MSNKIFNPKEYWNERLKENYSLLGVGDISLGLQYNKLLYIVRKFVFGRVYKKLKLENGAKVLDIGSGTGFYIEQWKRKYIRNIEGYDISEKAISELSNKFPEYSFKQVDISEELDEKSRERYDCISTFDVLFHIVDDDKYKVAIRNISSLLNHGGYFIYSDNLMSSDLRIKHQVCRTLDFVMNILKANGFELIKKTPMFVLMNNPVKTKNKVLKKLWSITSNIIRKQNLFSKILGYLLLPMEIFLISILNNGPSTEVLVLRKQ